MLKLLTLSAPDSPDIADTRSTALVSLSSLKDASVSRLFQLIINIYPPFNRTNIIIIILLLFVENKENTLCYVRKNTLKNIYCGSIMLIEKFCNTYY